jgi:hypothetical protein
MEPTSVVPTTTSSTAPATKNINFKESTRLFKVKEIIYDDGACAAASGFWDGEAKLRVGIRWYSEGVGFPNAFAKPSWFLLPDLISNFVLAYKGLAGFMK